MGSLAIWYRSLGTVSVDTVSSPKAEMFYWVTIMFSQTLGTALGDWTAGTASFGYIGGAMVFSALLALVVCGVLLDNDISHAAFLGCVHPYAPLGCCGRRFS